MIHINEVELADILATGSTVDELVINGDYESEDDLYREFEDVYTFKNEEIQDVFNRWYDYYYDIICKCGEE